MHTLRYLLLCLIQAIFGILSSSSTAGPIDILLGMSTCGCESPSLTYVSLRTVLLLSRESKLEQVVTLPLCFEGLGWDFLLFSPCCQALPSKQTHRMSYLFTSRYFSAAVTDLKILQTIIKITPAFVAYFSRIVFHLRCEDCNPFSFSFCSRERCLFCAASSTCLLCAY